MAERIVIASTREEAGKTSLIIGLAKALNNKKIGYAKPLGDRLLYAKKRLWDYDSALVTNILGLTENPESITIGFNHSKLRFMYDKEGLKQKINEIVDTVSADKDIVLIEGSKDIAFGSSVFLDPITVAKTCKAKLLLVLGGYSEDTIIDDLTYLKNYVNTTDIDLLGVIITQLKDVTDFQETYADLIKELEIPILGLIPYHEEMNYFTMDYLSQTIFGKVIAGEKGLQNIVKHIFVGAMSASEVVKRPHWTLKNKLIITPGDRSDMILAALDSDTAGIVLTNNIIPDDPILTSKANLANIPMILVPGDTFAVAKQIDDMEILFTKDETDKIDLLEKLVRENVDLTAFSKI